MKTITLFTFLVTIVLILSSFAGVYEPWKKEQITDPKELATLLQSDSKNIPAILNVGPMGNIKSAIKVGEVASLQGINKLVSVATAIPKNKDVVIYCGCCSYDNCPNIRPAFTKLKELGFKNCKVLNITESLRVDWQAKGYPME